MSEKRSRGRPPYLPTEKELGQVRQLAAMGLLDAEIAKVVGVDVATLRKHFAHELAVGPASAIAKVAQSLFKQATDPEKPNVVAAIFWLKARAGWRDGDAGSGKKEERQASAVKASAGSKFSPSAPPPKLVVNNK